MPAERQAANTVGKCSASSGPSLAAIEKGAAAACDLAIDGARHDVAGPKLGVLVHGAHEALAARVDQGGAFAAQSFGRERRRIAADIDGGRMELHEFGIGDHRPSAGRDGDTLAARLAWIGGDRIDLARSSSREHDRARRQDEAARESGVICRRDLEPGHAAVSENEIARGQAFEHGDRRRRAHRLHERVHDSAPRRVALDVKNAALAVRRLAAEGEMAFEVLVEGDAVAQQVLDALTRLARKQECDLLIDDAGAGRDRVGGVIFRAIALGERRGDAGLRPEARRSFAEARRRDDRDRTRRELERGEESGKPGADHDHI